MEQNSNYKNILIEGEVAKYSTTIHPAILIEDAIFVGIWALIIGIPAGLFGIFFLHTPAFFIFLIIPSLKLIDPYISYKTSFFLVTDQRVVIRTGFLKRRSYEIYNKKIESVSESQGIIGRRFNYGSVIIRGTGGGEEEFLGIRDASEFKKEIQKQVQASN